MALVAARQRGAPDPEFEVVGDLQGARKALKNKEADLFMWEKFTTKPLVDSGEWSRVAEVPTPWPCFSVAASDADGAVTFTLAYSEAAVNAGVWVFGSDWFITPRPPQEHACIRLRDWPEGNYMQSDESVPGIGTRRGDTCVGRLAAGRCARRRATSSPTSRRTTSPRTWLLIED